MAGQYRFKDINGNIVAQISASAAGAISFSGSAVDFSNASTITLGQVQLAGTASNALLLDGFDSTAFVFTSSFNTISQSISSQLTTLQTTSGSNIGRLNNLESKSSSVDISISNINSVTSSVLSRTSNLESKSSSVDISITNINSVTASNLAHLSNLESKSASVDISISNINTFTSSNGNTSLNNLTGSLATTGSNSFYGTQVFSGSVYIANDLIVQGSSSIQYISASSVSIGTNIVQLNTANPSVRFAGLTIVDSGSVGGSGSFLYDSVHDEFVFVHRGNGTNITSSHFVLGPETYDSLGNETYLTTNILSKGTGKEHLIDSCIFDNGTTTCIKNNLIGTGTTCFQSDVYINGDLRMSGNDSFIWSPSGSSTGFTGFYDAYNSQIALMVCNNSGHLLLQPARCNVGIGTNNPTNKLTISNNGDAVVAFKINDTNANASFLSLNASNTDSAIIAGGTSAIPFDIYTGGCSRMRITSTGIACFACQICTKSLWFASNTTGQITFGNNDACNPYIVSDSNNSLYLGNNNSYKILIPQDGCDMVFRTSATYANPQTRLTITSAGNVAIGATSNLNNFTIKSSSDTITSGGLSFQSRTCVTNFIAMGLNSCNDFEIQTWTAPSWITRLYIKNNGNIGIGTTVGTAALGIGGSGAQTTANLTDGGSRIGIIESIPIGGEAGNGGALVLGSDTWGNGAGRGQIALKALLINGSGCGTSDLAFSLRNDPSCSNLTERMRITSTGIACFACQVCAPSGVKFGSGSSTLNYYEVGSWTPDVIRSSSNPTVSYVERYGSYVRVGNVVNLWFDITMSSISGGSGTYLIAGLPFTVSASMAGYSRVVWRDFSAAVPDANTVVSGFVQKGDTYIYPQNDFTGVCFGTKAATQLQAGRMTGFVSYQA